MKTIIKILEQTDKINLETRKVPPHNKDQKAVALKHPVIVNFLLSVVLPGC